MSSENFSLSPLDSLRRARHHTPMFVISMYGQEVARAHNVAGASAVAEIFVACRRGHTFAGTASTAEIIAAMNYRNNRKDR